MAKIGELGKRHLRTNSHFAHRRTLRFNFSDEKRAALSLPANISEGTARQTKKEFIQFLHMAQGSLSELDTHLEVCVKLAYLEQKSLSEISQLMNDIDRMITGLIKSLKSLKSKS